MGVGGDEMGPEEFGLLMGEGEDADDAASDPLLPEDWVSSSGARIDLVDAHCAGTGFAILASPTLDYPILGDGYRILYHVDSCVWYW